MAAEKACASAEKTCARCEAKLSAEAFSKRQWKSGTPTCTSCLAAPAVQATPAAKTKRCFGPCALDLTADRFTKRQWKRAQPRCDACAVAPAASAAPTPAPEPWPFAVDVLDQCETPALAYEHIAPLLRLLAGALGRAPAALRIYDPYYCAGAAKAHLAALGFKSVHHERVDFYKAIAERTTPPFDVLVTNPPWSGDHVERCLRFCRASGKPWFVLLPNFVPHNTQRDHFDKIMRLTFTAGGAPAEPLCVVPRAQYRYAERFLKSERDVRTRHFALWCAELCAAAPAILTKQFWAKHAPVSALPDVGADAAAAASWRDGADTVRSVRHLPYHALDARDPRKRTLASSRRKSHGGAAPKRARAGGEDFEAGE